MCKPQTSSSAAGHHKRAWLLVGVSFLGVRSLILVDVPLNAVELAQRVGRAVRFMGHAALPEAERHVRVVLYATTVTTQP